MRVQLLIDGRVVAERDVDSFTYCPHCGKISDRIIALTQDDGQIPTIYPNSSVQIRVRS